jgi:hypothetical protein
VLADVKLMTHLTAQPPPTRVRDIVLQLQTGLTAVEYGPYLTTLILIVLLAGLSLNFRHHIKGLGLLHLLLLPNNVVAWEKLHDI